MTRKVEFKIMGKAKGIPTEEIDSAETRESAKYLLQEYQMAFGMGWMLWIKPITTIERRIK